MRNACADEPAGSGSIYAVSGLLLQATSISKNYAGVHALKDVSFGLRAGEVHALVGENGAGKSTLIKIITGAVSPDAGSLTVGGRVAPRMDPHTSRALGIAAIYQQPALFPDLTVAENIALFERARIDLAAGRLAGAAPLGGTAARPRRRLDRSRPDCRHAEHARTADGGDRESDRRRRAHSHHGRTHRLAHAREVDRLFAVIHLLRVQDVGIIYISHRLDEISAIADRITVLRDGEAVATTASTGVDRAGLIRLMVGRELSSVFPKRRVGPGS